MFFSMPFRCRPTSFLSSSLAAPSPSPVAILHRQRAFRAGSRLLPACSMRECHPPKSPLFRLLRPLHLCSRLPKHDIDFHDVIKCNHFYRQPPPSPPLQPTTNRSKVAQGGSDLSNNKAAPVWEPPYSDHQLRFETLRLATSPSHYHSVSSSPPLPWIAYSPARIATTTDSPTAPSTAPAPVQSRSRE